MTLITYHNGWIFILALLYFTNDTVDDSMVLTSLGRFRNSNSPISNDPRAYVVLAADFDSPTSIANYGILTTLTSFIWHRVFNVTPIVILGTREEGRLTTVAEVEFSRLIRQAGGRVHCISRTTSRDDGVGVALDPQLVGNYLITALQVSRLASIALHYMEENDVIFTSDADIWPMSNSFWSRLLSTTLRPENDKFFVYSGPFFYSQREKKDCNFLALTSVAAKTRIWREILFKWIDSLQYAPSPRAEFCEYPNFTESNPILPWYTKKERDKYNHMKSGSILRISFPVLLRIFLEQGQKAYGSIWENEIRQQYSDDSYKKNHIWNFDQVLIAEMVLASRPSVLVNEDFRRLDKLGPVGTDAQFIAAVLERTVENFTDAHLDGVEEKNWWRLEEIWLLVFKEKSPLLQSAAIDFFEEVRDFSVFMKEMIVSPSFFEEKNSQESAESCDEV